jgi:hypothetical protein
MTVARRRWDAFDIPDPKKEAVVAVPLTTAKYFSTGSTANRLSSLRFS